MKIPFHILCLLLATFCLLPACKGKKEKNKTSDLVKSQPTATELLSGKIADNELSADWLSATLKINANDGSRSQNFAADMRWQKNKAMWLSVYPNFGIKIEVGRALITPDSVRVIDRFNRKYYAYPISYLQTLTGYPIDFNTLQRIIAGSRLLAPDLPCQTDTLSDAYVLKTSRNTLNETIRLNRNDYTATQLSLEDQASEQTIQIAMSNYKLLNNKQFSHSRKINIRSKSNNYKADIDFSDLNIATTPLEMPFSVSGKYNK